MADEVQIADELYAKGAFQSAMLQYQSILQKQPNVAEIHYRVASTAARLQQTDLAAQHFREAIRLNPNFAYAHGELARLLMENQQVQQGMTHARTAMQLAPGEPTLALAMALSMEAARQTEPAWEIAQRLLSQGFEASQLGVLFARLAPRLKRENEAITFINKLLESGRITSSAEQSSLNFAAANLLDRMGQYDAAFEHAARANQIRGDKYDPGPADRLIRDFTHYFTRPVLRRLPRGTHGDETPVFIIGMPRSGTTLIEQILASHPAVYATGESDRIFNVWQSAIRRHGDVTTPLSQSVDQLTARDVDELAEAYLAPLRGHSGGAARVTDKSLPNFMYLGLIAILFPLARVIHCRRDPLDTCLSCFMTDFATGNRFSSSLSAAGQYFQQNERMMSHWKSVLDLKILDVNYEQVVADVEGQSRRIVEFLNLPWDPRCLRFFENERFVATASQAQVREPIYDRSVGRWRHYERHLGPLRAALG